MTRPSIAGAEAPDVLHFRQMRNTLTVRLPKDLSEWLKQTAKASGMSRGAIIRNELKKNGRSSGKPFLRLAGTVDGPADLSMRKSYSPK